jgi:uncharacterized membrane protein
MVMTNTNMNKNRLEAFSDGIFAIIITLTVFEIKVPELQFAELSNELLRNKVLSLAPNFASFFLTVAVVAMFWLSHHFLFSLYAKNIDRVLTQLNFAYLAFLSLIPFSASLLGKYPSLPFAVIAYGFNILSVLMISWAMINYALISPQIENGEITSRTLKQGKIRLNFALICTGFGILMGFWNTPIAIVLYLFPVVFTNIPGMLTFCEKLFGFEIK